MANGDTHEIAHVRVFDVTKDLAVVQVNGFGLPAIALGNSEEVAAGAKLSTMSLPMNGTATSVAIAVREIRRLQQGFRVFELQPSLDRTNAGGPILNETGTVVAILSAGGGGPAEPLVGLPINYVRAVLGLDEKLSLKDLSQNERQPIVATDGPATSTAATPTSRDATSGTGTVVFYRIRRFVGSALEPSVYCNDQELANMDNGRYFKASLLAGSYVCRSTDQTVVSFDLAPGETRYMRVEIITGFMKGHGSIHEVPARQGAIEIQKLKPLDAENIKTATLAR